jgi:S-formylglutathione hydrolase FrmB
MRASPRFLLLVAAWLPLAPLLSAAQLEVLQIPGETLKGNPLRDPIERPVAVLSPDDGADRKGLPLVIYLPGWGGSSAEVIAKGSSHFLGQVVDRMAQMQLPLRIAVVDARSRYRGTQYLNSTATGRYADYVTDEIFQILLARYGEETEHPGACLLAGHSSGGYGALILAMANHRKFYATVALSPDSDFETTHKPLCQAEGVRSLSPQDLEAAQASPEQAHLPENGMASLILGLSANYTPDPTRPGHFDWLYDAAGQWRPEVWQRWLANDPLTRVREHQDAFDPAQRIYLDGPNHDDFGANIGARKIYDILHDRPAPVVFNEPYGRHSEHLPERLERGLVWVLRGEKP